MFMRGRRVFVAGFAMFVSRLRMLFGFFMLAHVMMMGGLMVMVSGSCETGVAAGMAANSGIGDMTAIATPAAPRSEAARFSRTLDM